MSARSSAGRLPIALARDGVAVAVTELPDRLDRAEETIRTIADEGGRATTVTLDVRSPRIDL